MKINNGAGEERTMKGAADREGQGGVVFTKHLLCAKHSARPFICVLFQNPHKNPGRWV